MKMNENGFENRNEEPNTFPENHEYAQQTVAPQPPEPPKKKGKFGLILTAAVVAAAFGGSLLTAFVFMPIASRDNAQAVEQLPTKEEIAAQYQAPEETPQLGGNEVAIENLQNPVVEIADSISDSVVGIRCYDKEFVSGQEPVENLLAAGTGFVISDDGYILTNNHVVSGGNLYKIVTSDGEERTAELVGADSLSDIAVLRIEGLSLPAVPLGDSDSLKAGEISIAIGNINEDRFNNSVTVGYVSVVDKEIVLDGRKMDVIQTDAAINPGNSGGPLINGEGKVIGVNTAKRFYSGTDAYGNVLNSEGVGFAIPINRAIDIAQELIENGSIPRAGIGLTYSLISETDAKLWDTPRGALVVDVIAGGPADKAGIQPNDIILEIDGVDLTDGEEMPPLTEMAIGTEVAAKVWREGKEYQTTFVLEDMNTFND